jgi:AraC-like DNA-binding protein
MVRRNHLPIGRVFRPRETRFVTDAVLLMYLEVAHAEVDWQRAVAHQLELLFIRLRRSLGSHAESLGRAKMVTRERMRNVRMEMRGMPERRWCVDEMAGLASLSRSRFSALYREFFGVSPREDLTAARLERARRLLSASVMTVDQVARHVGYDDPAYFNRLFKRKVGITPGSYR